MEEQDECAVCLLELGEVDGQETLGACGHVFHWGCIAEWQETGQRKSPALVCPYCRQAMS